MASVTGASRTVRSNTNVASAATERCATISLLPSSHPYLDRKLRNKRSVTIESAP
jgi:hypothetical protein